MVFNIDEVEKFQKIICFLVSLEAEGKTIRIDFIVDLEILTPSLVTFLIVII